MRHKEVTEYAKGFKYLHWIVAILVLCMLCFGFFLGDLPKDLKPTAYMVHKSTGLTILALMLIRGIWVLSIGRPKLPRTIPKWERKLSGLVQGGLYFFLIFMAFSGWLMATASGRVPVYFGLFEVPFPGLAENQNFAELMNGTHKIIAWILVGLVFLHIAGALKHWLIQKDDIMRRMLP